MRRSNASAAKLAQALMDKADAEAIRVWRHIEHKNWHVDLGWNDPDPFDESDELVANWRSISMGKTVEAAIEAALEKTADQLNQYRIGAVAYLSGQDA